MYQFIQFQWDVNSPFSHALNVRADFQYLLFMDVQVAFRLHLGSSQGEPFGTVQARDNALIRIPIEIDSVVLELLDSTVPYNDVTLYAYLSDTPIDFKKFPVRGDLYFDPGVGSGQDFITWTPNTNAATILSAMYLYSALGIMTGWRESLSPEAADGDYGGGIGVVLPTGWVTDSARGKRLRAYSYASHADVGNLIVEPYRRTTFAVRAMLTNTTPLSNVFPGVVFAQYLTFFHPATATKKVRILSLDWALVASSAAVDITAHIFRLSSAVEPATGNPAATVTSLSRDGGSAETTVLCLPTTTGVTTGGAIVSDFARVGVTGAGSAANPPSGENWRPMLPHPDMPGFTPLDFRAGVAEGYVFQIEPSGAATVDVIIRAVFTEETE